METTFAKVNRMKPKVGLVGALFSAIGASI